MLCAGVDDELSLALNSFTGQERLAETTTSESVADFSAAVKRVQSTSFLRREGARGWRASFDRVVANQVNLYAVLEGKYDEPHGGADQRKRRKPCTQ